MNWTIGRRITLGFTAVLVVVACIGVFALNRVHAIARSNGAVTANAMPSIVLFAQIESLVKGNFINTTQHLDATDAARMAAIEREMNEKSDKLTALYKEVEPISVNLNIDPAGGADECRRYGLRSHCGVLADRSGPFAGRLAIERS